MPLLRDLVPAAVILALSLGLAGCGGGGGGAGGSAGANAGGAGSAGTGGNGGTGPMTDGIVVNTPSDYVATESAADGYCDLLEAVAAAGLGKAVHECANPRGSRRVVLTAGSRYPTGKTVRFASPSEPDLPFRLGLADGAAGNATIFAADPWLLDPGDPPTRCLVHASNGASVALSDVTLTQAPSISVSGACVVRGALAVRNSRVTGFRQGGISAICRPDAGCDFDSGDGARLQVAGSLVDGNSTPDDGAGLYSAGFGATIVVYHSSIVNNTAAGAGGGIYFGGGWNTHVIRASTVSGNAASVGGGVMVKFECSNTYLHVFSSTLADNTAQGTGGGIQFEPADLKCAKQDVSVYASIVGGNHSVSTLESNINAGWWTDDPQGNAGTFSCIGGSFIYVAPGYPLPTEVDDHCVFSSRDPRLGPLMSMGGAGRLPVHPLLAGSAAIDAVTDVMYEGQYEDQRDGWIPDLDPPVAHDDWSLFDRLADGNDDGRTASDFGAIDMNPRWQTELLPVADKGPSPHRVVVDSSGFDRGAGTEYAAASATNEFVTYRLPIAEPGYYELTAGLRETPSGGRFQMAVADDPSGPWTDVGTIQDGFARGPTFAAFGPFSTPLFATPGEKAIRFTIAGKNAASGGYGLSLDYIDARVSTKDCLVGQIAAGANHTCALAAGGARCWGSNESGQLGNGTVASAGRAPAVDSATGVSALAAGARHTCALMAAAGGVRCWGANQAGQLGDGTTTERHAPPATDALTGVSAIAAGANHTCVLTQAGGVRCWGANESGQLGDGTTTGRDRPPTTDVLSGVKAIAAGANHTCALLMTGGVRCWGANTFGQLGDGTTADRPAPPERDVITDVASLSAGSAHTCIVTSTGGVRCWGHNGGGELGEGSLLDAPAPPPTDVLVGVRAVAAGANFTCALMAAGGVRCWGYNSDGQIGDETPNATERTAPPAADILPDAKTIGAGNAHVCAATKTGGIRCWGANTSGQLGDGLTPDSATTPPPLDVVTFSGTCR